ncbi:hypothetical protein LTR86_010910 [Recurvomyces mirabilis]|nr:hypothetical protein LTR86_010910 [Recurvomyces mirabilis]
MDTYLCIVLGRPKHYNDDDIDQKFPDPIVDESLTAFGHTRDIEEDSPVDGLIWHAKLAQIISATSREVYTVKRTTTSTRLSAIYRLGAELKHWRNNLPPHLGKIKASSLVPTLKRQSLALRLAYCHAQMHTHRAILVESHGPTTDSRQMQDSVDECLKGAETAMETVEAMVKDGALFYSLWWSQYVLFCALSVAFVFAIQLKKGTWANQDRQSHGLLDLANRCKTLLWDNNFAGARYTVILDELMKEAQQISSSANGGHGDLRESMTTIPTGSIVHHDEDQARSCTEADVLVHEAYPDLFDDWDPSDWLDLDASAYNTLFE